MRDSQTAQDPAAPPLLSHFPGWNQVWTRLEARRSVLLHGPKYSRRRLFSKVFRRWWNRDEQARSVEFHVPSVAGREHLEADVLAREARKQAGLDLGKLSGEGSEARAASFFAAFRRALERDPGSTLVVIRGGRRGLEESYHALVSGFCELLGHFEGLQAGDLTLLVLDDYSMYFYENWRFEVSSFDLVPVYLRVPRAAELKRFLALGGAKDPGAAAERLLETTGGHHGLILELLDTLGLEASAPPPSADHAPDLSPLLEDELEPWIEGGQILHELQRLLAAQPRTFCSEALRHQKPKLFPPKTPDPQYLTELGVLVRSGMNRLVLCPGAVAGMVEDMSSTVGPPPRVERGPTSGSDGFGDIPVEDDDFLVVHLSDLHVGPSYRYHLTTQDFEGRKKAHHLLREDLDQFGIRRRIDALVVSGDFVERGNAFDQFQRAREVMSDILDDLELDPSRLVVVAGNHDLDWQPAELSAKNERTGVSRENYETFYRLLQKEPCAASLTRIPSRGDGPALRLLGLDSNLVEGPDAGGIGYLGSDTLAEATELLRRADAESPQDVQDLTWLVVHHHLFPATSPGASAALGKHISTFANASELLYHARRWRSELILHGHEHQPSITVAQRWTYPPRGHEPPFFPVISVGAGSFALGNHLGPIGRNHYYIIHRRKNEVRFHSRILDDHGAAFTHHDQVHVPL